MEYNKYLQIFENSLNGRDRTRTSEDGISGSVKEIIYPNTVCPSTYASETRERDN